MRDTLDRSILDRFVRGDQKAFESVYRHFEADVYRWIVRIVRDEDAAEDSRDLWPLIVERSQESVGWSWLDVGLVAIVAILLLMRPSWLWLLAYHL